VHTRFQVAMVSLYFTLLLVASGNTTMYFGSPHCMLSGGSWAALYSRVLIALQSSLLNCRPIRTMKAEGTSAVYSGRGEGFSWFIRIGL